MKGSNAMDMLMATAAFESSAPGKMESSLIDIQGVAIHRQGESLVMCEIYGDVACVRGKGFTFEQAGNERRFVQTGKIPSIRAAKVLAKSLAEWRSGA